MAASSSARERKKHIMMSYAWTSAQDLVYEIAEQLQNEGIPVWMDIRNGLGGKINDGMAEAVENSAAVCFFMTESYQTSKNCKKELEYADKLEIPIIPCRCDGKFKPSGWLGFISAGLMWYDFRDLSDKPVNSTMNKLINYIQTNILKVSPTVFPDLEGRTQPVIFSNRHRYRTLLEPSDKALVTTDFEDGDDGEPSIRGDQVDSSSRNRFETKPDVESVPDKNSSTDNIDCNNGKSGHRFTSLDDHESLQQMRLPLCGYEKYPLVSLEESVRPLQALLDANIDRFVFIAKKNSQKAKEGLTQDESAAIRLYSMEWAPTSLSLYIQLNRALRAVNRHGLIPWFPYLKLLLTALFKLPPLTTTVWRGVRGDLSSQYETGQTITWWGVSSCTSSVSVMDGFIGNSGSRTLFSIDAKNARSIRHHSMFAMEDEILLLPGTYLHVISKLNPTKDLTIIQMKEETPPFPLLEHPESPSAILLHDSSHQETDSALPAQLSEPNNEPPGTELKPPNKKLSTRVNLFMERLREKYFQ